MNRTRITYLPDGYDDPKELKVETEDGLDLTEMGIARVHIDFDGYELPTAEITMVGPVFDVNLPTKFDFDISRYPTHILEQLRTAIRSELHERDGRYPHEKT